MAGLLRQGPVDGGLDPTTTECAGDLVGGVLSTSQVPRPGEPTTGGARHY